MNDLLIKPLDSPQRKISSKARAIVHYKINSDFFEYKEETGNDVGRDCIIELSNNDMWGNDKIEGQIKGTKKLEILKNGDITFSFPTKTINYALSSSNSFVLFLVDIIEEKVYYLSIQDYFLENGIPFKKLNSQEKINIHLNKENYIKNNDNNLVEIAKRRYYLDLNNNIKRIK